MIVQLVERVRVGAGGRPGMSPAKAAALVLAADPLDIILHMEQVWDAYNPWKQSGGPAGRARRAFFGSGEFEPYAPTRQPAWDHLGYSYVLENTRAVQILRRVVREYRSGEGLGVPSSETQRWLDTTEALLFGAGNPISMWLSTSTVRQDPEGVRRNAYWRMFGLDLAFGADDNRPATYDKAPAANTGFVRLFEELLYELWQAITNLRNIVGANAADDDRIFRIAEELRSVLRSRRQTEMLAREELAAATALGWVDLTLSVNSPVVNDLKATATSQAVRLQLIGQRVGLSAHSKSAALFSMCAELSLFLRVIEDVDIIKSPDFAWVLYASQPPATAGPGAPAPIGESSRRVITEWAAATGKDLKARARPVDTTRRQVVAVR